MLLMLLQNSGDGWRAALLRLFHAAMPLLLIIIYA